MACGPAASSAMVIADTATSSGSIVGSITPRSMTTEVSINPRGRRPGSGTRGDCLFGYAVHVVAEPAGVDRRGAGESCCGCLGRDEAATT